MATSGASMAGKELRLNEYGCLDMVCLLLHLDA
jgi:hypothetical protein